MATPTARELVQEAETIKDTVLYPGGARVIVEPFGETWDENHFGGDTKIEKRGENIYFKGTHILVTKKKSKQSLRRPLWGRDVSDGHGCTMDFVINGKSRPVKEGDHVLFGRYVANETRGILPGHPDWIVMMEDDIIAVMEITYD